MRRAAEVAHDIGRDLLSASFRHPAIAAKQEETTRAEEILVREVLFENDLDLRRSLERLHISKISLRKTSR